MRKDVILQGKYIRLDPLDRCHIPALAEAAKAEPSLYRWTPVPQGMAETTEYVETALRWRDAGIAVPFATVRISDGTIVGSTRFFDLEQWAWPTGHPRHGRGVPDVGEIGYTWLTQSAVRTAANTESKLLMLMHAFEAWQVVRVSFHTDVRNTRSRAALERIGGRFEGVLRSHRMAVDHIPRDSARYSIVASEWPETKGMLEARLSRD